METTKVKEQCSTGMIEGTLDDLLVVVPKELQIEMAVHIHNIHDIIKSIVVHGDVAVRVNVKSYRYPNPIDGMQSERRTLDIVIHDRDEERVKVIRREAIESFMMYWISITNEQIRDILLERVNVDSAPTKIYGDIEENNAVSQPQSVESQKKISQTKPLDPAVLKALGEYSIDEKLVSEEN
ncbi:MAG: hypothetical protein ACK4NC_02995 [Candidatus Gracilibacteria bacterium]